jgi:hypothetical protein
MRRRGGIAIVAAALVTMSRARADEHPDATPALVVILSPSHDAFGRRVAAELESLGLRAEILDPGDEPASRASLETSARRAGAVAAVRSVPSERGIEVWITDRITGKTVLRELPIGDDGPEDEGASALRTVELLRASLLEITLPDRAPGDIPPPSDLRTKMKLDSRPATSKRPATHPKAAPPTLRSSLSPALLLSPGGFSPAATLEVGVEWLASPHIGPFLFGGIPLSGSETVRDEGSADLDVALMGWGLRFAFATPASRWVPALDVGLAAVSLQTSGSSERLVERSESVLVLAPISRAGLAVAVTPTLRIRADVLVGAVVQGVSVRFGGREVATWGAPFVMPALGADWGWF